MANKKNKTKPATTPQPKNTKRRKLLKIALIIVGLFVVLGTVDTLVKAVKLSASGKKLNDIQAEIRDSGLDVSLYRDNFCWKVGSKLSEGYPACAQRLVIVGKNKPVPIQKTESKKLIGIVEDVVGEKIYTNEFVDYGESGVVYADKEISNTSGCILDYNAYDNTYAFDDLAHNIYSIDVSCAQEPFVVGVYKMYTGYHSWIWYEDPQIGED